MTQTANIWTKITGDSITMPEQGKMVIIRRKDGDDTFGYAEKSAWKGIHDGQPDGKAWWIWYECTVVRYDSETCKVRPVKEEAIRPPTHWRPIG